MKLQKRLSRKVGKKEYVKWVITVPPNEIERLGWDEGQKLKTEVSDVGLVIKKSSEPSYQDFKTKISELLREKSQGLTWNEIKEKLKLEIKVPNNRWVRKLEDDVSLRRMNYNGQKYWYLDKNGITVYTIGYEGRSIEEFMGILKMHNIECLIDVRELPLSRKNGFSKSILSKKLEDKNIIYRHFPELGSPREIRHELWGGGNYEKFFKAYSEWLSSPHAKTYIGDVEGWSHVKTTAIMCFEKDVEKCHRSIIKKRLIQDGFKVVDI